MLWVLYPRMVCLDALVRVRVRVTEVKTLILLGVILYSVWGSIPPLQASIGSTQGGVAMLVDSTITGLTLINSEFSSSFMTS